ncbi:MAG: hydrogenase maturation nickel metallochaperone HypA [Bacteroidetes bacterium]|nr:hydrogenase maturation nickel metallochaperone HypA [Bacteroidota bacterium]
MHELSIAQSVVEIVTNTVRQENLHRVLVIRMKVGAMVGVVIDSLKFSFQAITVGTPLEQAQLTIEAVPFQIQCTTCGRVSKIDDGVVQCPLCNSFETCVVSGNELTVTAIEISDD